MYVNLCKKKVAVYTLGCKVNQYESDSMQDLLASEGCEIVAFDDAADIYIINTCSVTNMAERKSRQIINRARKRNPSSVVVAAGCYVQAAAEELKNNLAVDILVGNNRKKDMARILDEFLANREPLDTLIDINAEHEYESSIWISRVSIAEHLSRYRTGAIISAHTVLFHIQEVVFAAGC